MKGGEGICGGSWAYSDGVESHHAATQRRVPVAHGTAWLQAASWQQPA